MKIKIDIPAKDYVRKLIELPFPTYPLQKFKIQGWNKQLYVKAISSIELDRYKDDIANLIINTVLIRKNNSWQRAFTSKKSLNNLFTYPELNLLYNEALHIINEISPTLISTTNIQVEKIKEGLNDPTNKLICTSLGNCFSIEIIGDKIRFKDQPELYYDIPRKELLDCHWIVYYQARNIQLKETFPETNKTDEEKMQELKKQIQLK